MSEKQSIVLVGQNLMFMPPIQMAAAPLGYEVRQARTEQDFWDAYRSVVPRW